VNFTNVFLGFLFEGTQAVPNPNSKLKPLTVKFQKMFFEAFDIRIAEWSLAL
jgi:hypothetical protein